jgi:predicted unusual protein kinase regulating ubiquinone biosynthesis (AarF/ABC1/UbiB family)
VLDRIRTGYHAARRIGQTSFALQKSGWRWFVIATRHCRNWRATLQKHLGSTYIKLGQLIASSPSLFPHDYVEAFQSCLDQTSSTAFCNY